MPKLTPTRPLCFLGIHRMDSWEYWQDDSGRQPSDHHMCFQYGACQRCGAMRNRLQHHWVESYCTRCGLAQPLCDLRTTCRYGHPALA